MTKWIIFGGIALLILVIMFACIATKVGGSNNPPASPTATPRTTIGPATVGGIAQWNNFPLSRPSWCVSPAKWTMGQLPSNKGLVPACESTNTVAYLGNYDFLELGCQTVIALGASSKPNGFLIEPNGKPDYGAYTKCAKTAPSTIAPTRRP